jgi:glycosyltransferase involved in cell wall biosynthesis
MPVPFSEVGERLDEEVLPLVVAEYSDADQATADGPGRGSDTIDAGPGHVHPVGRERVAGQYLLAGPFAGNNRAGGRTEHHYGHRIRFTGVLTGAALSRAYTTADLLVAPSRWETYGMVVTEALAHGLPVIAAAVGGLPEALGATADGTRPGQLVPPGDPAALAAALGDWLGDERYRHRLRAAARQRRSALRGWEQTTQDIADALTAHGCPSRSCGGPDLSGYR